MLNPGLARLSAMYNLLYQYLIALFCFDKFTGCGGLLIEIKFRHNLTPPPYETKLNFGQ